MKSSIRTLLSTAILALVACSPLIYGKLDSPSVAVTESKIPFPAYTGPANVTLPPNLFSFDFNIGQIGVDETEKDSSLKLNTATIAIDTTSSPSTATLEGIKTFVLTMTDSAGIPQAVAHYDPTATPPAGSRSQDGKTITLVPIGDIELLGFLKNQKITISIGGSGTPPNVAWTGTVTLDFHVIAQKNVV